jgi:hypothetical protein
MIQRQNVMVECELHLIINSSQLLCRRTPPGRPGGNLAAGDKAAGRFCNPQRHLTDSNLCTAWMGTESGTSYSGEHWRKEKLIRLNASKRRE